MKYKDQKGNHSLFEFGRKGVERKIRWCDKCIDKQWHLIISDNCLKCSICGNNALSNQENVYNKFKEESLPHYLRSK